MKKEKLNFTNYDIFAFVLTLLISKILTITPTNFIKNASTASPIVFIIFSFIIFLIYGYILKTILRKEYDFFTLIKNTYSNLTCKIICIVFYIYFFINSALFTLNIALQLKVMTYILSPLYSIGIYILVGAFLGSYKGFNSLFKIISYIFPLLIMYILLIFLLGLNFMDIYNFLPILGKGFKESILYNIPSFSMFSPLLLFLFFTKNNSDSDYIRNKVLFKKIIISFCIIMILTFIVFLNTMPLKLIATRLILLFDINRMLSQLPSSQKLEPVLILVYSILSFIYVAFAVLCACMSFEKANITKDYKTYILPSLIVMGLSTFIPITMNTIYKFTNVFSYITIFICIVFPLFTVIKYNLKERKNVF